MNWTRSNTLALSANSCARCHGTGLRGHSYDPMPCLCVTRAIFRICLNKAREIAAYPVSWHSSLSRLGRGDGAINCPISGRHKGEEFQADFNAIARRALTEEEYQIFRFHFLLGADWKLCCRRLKIERGTFFHSVYRIEATAGQAFAETLPYPIYPIDEYFAKTTRQVDTRPFPARKAA